MTRLLQRRVERLERTVRSLGRSHLIFAGSEAEFEQQKAELLASERWRDGDTLIRLSWLAPEGEDEINP